MLTYLLIVLCLSLTGVAGLQMAYMMYLDRLDKERKKRLHDLEIKCKELGRRLADAESPCRTRPDPRRSVFRAR